MFIKRLSAVSLAAVMALSLAGCGKKPGVAAEVGGVEIPMEEYYKSYAARANQFRSQYGDDVLQQTEPNSGKTTDELLREQAIQDLTETEMVRQDAEKMGIEVTDQDADKEIQAMKDQLGGDEVFQSLLKQNNMPEEFLKENIKKQKMTSEYTKKKLEELKPTEEEIQKYYDDNKDSFFKAKASHILVSDLKEANLIRKEIKKGGDFAKIAKEKSLDPGSKENGGSLGEFTNGQMVPEFDKAIAKMKVGDISEPIHTNYGYHVIKLEDKKPLEFKDVKAQIEQLVQQEKFTKYLQDLHKKAKIKVYADTKKEVELPDEFKDYGVIEKPKTEKNNAKDAKNNKANEKTNAANNSAKENTNNAKETK
ncbi:peptidylprolyl isomerase [Peptoniphilus sp.]|jgi:foldase protein PrsA|uniref:peptidylprolyl isomerase n=1 Tax=Peptoniphilus sp. TaxID=1971214 RepID=UPI003D918789